MNLSHRIGNISPSATLTITSKAKAMKAEGQDVISFGAGEPDFDTPDYIKKAAVAAIESGKTKYTPSIGTVELRKAICENTKNFKGLDYTPENVIVSNGAKHTLFNIFQAICDKDDEVIIPAPYWVSYTEMVKMAEAKPVIVDTLDNGYKLNAQKLNSAITSKTKAIILNSPSNPTGMLYSKSEIEEIARVAVDKDLTIVSDEIYDRLVYDNSKHISPAALGEEFKKNTIIVNGVSKTYSMTGWRIGYLLSSNLDLIKAIKNLQDHSSSNPSSISQEAALAALKDEDNSVELMRVEFEKRRDYMVQRINAIDNLSCIKPDGAFYCFVDVSKVNKNTLEFASNLLEKEKTAVIPGEGFGTPGFIRLSFATSMENIKEGLDRIERFVTR
ncbi:MAG: pyridoxal phosphate-dependent aminotransferase [Candidatus Omnitrophota bacterium]